LITFPKFKSDILYALDLDGVIIDSIEECFTNTIITHYGSDYNNLKVKELFYQYRGLVQPAYEYYFLIMAIEEYLVKEKNSIDLLFIKHRKNGITNEAKLFEKQFFLNRYNFQKQNLIKWMNLNPLTDFGKYLLKEKPKNIVIVTTKNKDSAVEIINYYNISTQEIYGYKHVKDAGSKGELLNLILDKSIFQKIIFIDDATEHLDTVNNKNIQCYFADWGYGNNTNRVKYRSL
jgi:phosphoglycolate phosphatase-like HAD superfamily hydrolase